MSTLARRSNGDFYVNYMSAGRQIRVGLRTKDEEIARARYANFMAYRGSHGNDPPVHHPENQHLPWLELVKEGGLRGKWLYAIYERARDRGRSKELTFNLTRSQLEDIALRSGGRCEVTRIPFTWDKSSYCKFSPFAPTLDRIVPRVGYTSSNCRLVAHAVNVAMADWGEEVFCKIAIEFLKAKGIVG